MEEDAPEPEALLRKREVEDAPVPEALLWKRGYRGLAVGARLKQQCERFTSISNSNSSTYT